MIALNIFLLLLIAIAVRFLGRRLLPLVTPPGKLRPVLLAWAGAAAGSLAELLLWPGGPHLDWLHPVGAAVGAWLFLTAAGAAPFFKTMVKGVRPR